MASSYREDDPRVHAERIKGMLSDVVEHVRSDVTKVNEPKAQALFETTAEVLKGLMTAYDDYENGKEKAWRK